MENWLTNLEIEVEDCAKDLANGYLLGRILDSYEVLTDFEEFEDSPAASFKNLVKLQFAFSRLQLKLDPHKLLSRSPRYARRTLTKLHKRLEAPSFSLAKLSNPSSSDKLDRRLEKFQIEMLTQAHSVLELHSQQELTIQQSQAEFRKEHIETTQANRVFMQQWEAEGRKN